MQVSSIFGQLEKMTTITQITCTVEATDDVVENVMGNQLFLQSSYSERLIRSPIVAIQFI